MSARLVSVWYWLGAGVAVVLVAAALLWNAWTFSQYSSAQRQLDILGVDLTTAAGERPAAGSPDAAEIELLLDADRRGILEENFLALLTDPQKRALADARQEKLADKASDRKTSLIFGVVLFLGGLVVYGIGRRMRQWASY